MEEIRYIFKNVKTGEYYQYNNKDTTFIELSCKFSPYIAPMGYYEGRYNKINYITELRNYKLNKLKNLNESNL